MPIVNHLVTGVENAFLPTRFHCPQEHSPSHCPAEARLRLERQPRVDPAVWMRRVLCLALGAEGGHRERVAAYARHITRYLGLSDREARLLEEAAWFHDAGKLAIPEPLRRNEANLSHSEAESMRRHTLLGHEMLAHAGSELLDLAAAIALSHHERFDGAGYPGGLAGEQIPLPARIVAVAEAFDTFRSQQIFQEDWGLGLVMSHFQSESGGAYDPRCVAAFFRDWEGVLVLERSGRGGHSFQAGSKRGE